MKNKPVANKKELLQLLRENSSQLRGYGVRKLMLFGSFVRDEGIHKKSDVDFFVDIPEDRINWTAFIALGDFLEDLLGRKVELIEPYRLSPFILPHVLNEVEDVELEAIASL
jgi:predicted nucleotidyltransferase